MNKIWDPKLDEVSIIASCSHKHTQVLWKETKMINFFSSEKIRSHFIHFLSWKSFKGEGISISEATVSWWLMTIEYTQREGMRGENSGSFPGNGMEIRDTYSWWEKQANKHTIAIYHNSIYFMWTDYLVNLISPTHHLNRRSWWWWSLHHTTYRLQHQLHQESRE